MNQQAMLRKVRQMQQDMLKTQEEINKQEGNLQEINELSIEKSTRPRLICRSPISCGFCSRPTSIMVFGS